MTTRVLSPLKHHAVWSNVFAGVNPKWHAAYSRALLEGDPSLVRMHIQLALASINERLRAPEIPESELESLHDAIRYLNLIRAMELQRPSAEESGAEKLA